MVENNARIIDNSLGGDYPIAPNKKRIILLGILIGLAIPTAIFFLILFLDTRVHNKKDITKAVTVPFLGEIPLDKDLQKQKRKGWVVNEKGDDMVSEAFRILRTNMSFMTNNGKKVQVITFTSFNEGAGKTFISSNLAMSLIHAKKK
jgi:Capsular polysaccharide biosynthesis protein